MRFFLTGGTGYIGAHILVTLLDSGHQVTALVRNKAKLGLLVERPGLTIVEAELSRAFEYGRLLEGHDGLVHCALIWGEEPYSELSIDDTAAAAKLFYAAGKASVKRCLFISSAAVHRPFKAAMNEDDCLTTADTYGATKAAGELFLRAACAEHGMIGTSLRLGPVVGAPAFTGAVFRSNNRLTEMVKAAAEGKSITIQQGDGRQWTPVAAVVDAIVALFSHPQPHATYIIVDRDMITWEAIAKLVVQELQSKSKIQVSPSAEQPPRFTTDRIESLLGSTFDSTSALIASINYLAKIL